MKMINRFPFPCGGGSIIPPVNPASDIVETFDYCGNAIYEDKVLTTLLFDGSYVLHVVRHGHPCHLYPHVSLLHEGSFGLFKKDTNSNS